MQMPSPHEFNAVEVVNMVDMLVVVEGSNRKRQ
jgi:hypothetical protein